MRSKFDDIAIIIPALNPNMTLIRLIGQLREKELNNIIVIDDGSSAECQKIFNELQEKYNVSVYKHEKNKGKGRAIKTGITQILDKNMEGVITVDADGQHLAKDVIKVAEKLKKERKIVLGERNVLKCKDTPFFSKIGNIFSTLYLKIVTGIYLKDTQTGLRGIPKEYFELALNIEGERFEYEMNFLKYICNNKIEFETADIETVYENRIRNFRVFKDSYIIYKEFIKNIISSLIAATIDVSLFYLFTKRLPISYSNIFARILSGIVDFSLNKKWVFKNKSQKIYDELCKYFILFFIQMVLNTVIVTALSKVFIEYIVIVKLFVNIILYMTNFFIKKKYIFEKK